MTYAVRSAESLGEWVRIERARQGLYLVDVAVEGVAKSTVCRWEHGKNISLESATRILAGLGYELVVLPKGGGGREAARDQNAVHLRGLPNPVRGHNQRHPVLFPRSLGCLAVYSRR